jgi:hypothetical protein
VHLDPDSAGTRAGSQPRQRKMCVTAHTVMTSTPTCLAAAGWCISRWVLGGTTSGSSGRLLRVCVPALGMVTIICTCATFWKMGSLKLDSYRDPNESDILELSLAMIEAGISAWVGGSGPSTAPAQVRIPYTFFVWLPETHHY